VLHATEFQRRTAWRHAPHHEVNASRTDWTQLFRIGFRSGVELGTGQSQRRFTVSERHGVLRLVASPDGRGSSLKLAHDAFVYSSILDPGFHAVHELGAGRGAWLHVVQGAVTLDEQVLATGDGAGAWSEPAMSFTALEPTEVLLLDLGASAATTSN
jgi:redox-sensitive bicupin YhaK (pirin superfamily)